MPQRRSRNRCLRKTQQIGLEQLERRLAMTAYLSLFGPTTPVTKGDKAVFSVALSEPMKTPQSVSMTTAPGTAFFGTDYIAAQKTQLIFSPGQTLQTFSVSTLQSAHLGLQNFQVIATAANPALGTRSATVWLQDYVPPPPTLSITVDSPVVAQGAPATFTISLTGTIKKPVTFTYATADGSAIAGTDYQATTGTLTFAPSAGSKAPMTRTVSVQTILQMTYGNDKTFSLTLSSVSGAVLGAAWAGETIHNTNLLPSPVPGTYSPAQFRRAYGFDLFAGDGSGTTIAIVDAGNAPNIRADLAAFDARFNIPAPPLFTIVNQNGGLQLPPDDPDWAGETTLDVEWAHAIAPGANILLVEADSASPANLLTAVNYARRAKGVVVVSNSYGGLEDPIELSTDSIYTTPAGHSGVTFCFSTGDHGEVSSPASSPNVLAVAGTEVTIDAKGNYLSERVWNDYGQTNPQGTWTTGGGLSQYEPRPSFQDGVQAIVGNSRGVADVAFNAAQTFPICMTDATSQKQLWVKTGGTSASCPVWAGLLAIADGKRLAAGKDSLANAQVALYSLPATDFHDITRGDNSSEGYGTSRPPNDGGYPAIPGYDLVSGLGTPKANLVIRDLIAYNGSTKVMYSASAVRSPSPISLSNYFSLVGAAPQATRLSAGGMGRPQSPVESSQLPAPLTAASQTAVINAAEAYRLGLRGRRPTVTFQKKPTMPNSVERALGPLLGS